MDGEILSNLYRCCFCNQIIVSSQQNPCCSIDVLTNIDKPKNQQYNQVFYCHMLCLKASMSEYTQSFFYIESLAESKINQINE